MKKILFITFLLSSFFAVSQKKTTVPKMSASLIVATPTIPQYDFLKSIKDKYENFILPVKLENLYVDDQLIQSQYEFKDESGSFTVILDSDNLSLKYTLNLINISSTSGTYLKLGKIIVKTELIPTKSEFNVYFDGTKEL
jgi:hypothetical protein